MEEQAESFVTDDWDISVWSSQVCHELEESGKLDNRTEIKIRFYDN